MSGVNVKLSYKQLHALKHALIQYMQRDSVKKEDYLSEQALLLKLNYQIEEMKERNNI